MSARVIRRPLLGWGFRSWLRGAFAGLEASIWVLASWGFCQAVYGLISELSGVV